MAPTTVANAMARGTSGANAAGATGRDGSSNLTTRAVGFALTVQIVTDSEGMTKSANVAGFKEAQMKILTRIALLAFGVVLLGCDRSKGECVAPDFNITNDAEFVRSAINDVMMCNEVASMARGLIVKTTIDIPLQTEVSRILWQYADSNCASKGWAVVMEANTGAIRALADSGRSAFITTNAAGAMAWRPGAVVEAYECGSIIKPLIAALALDEKVVWPTTEVSTDRNDHRYRQFKLPSEGCASNKAYYSVSEAIQKSSNVVFAKLGIDLGPKRLYEGLKKFGCGIPIKVGVSGDEEEGLLPCSDRWNATLRSRIPIGQGVKMTGLQIARAYAAFVNGGYVRTPHIIKSVCNLDEWVLYEHDLEWEPEYQIISEQTADLVFGMLQKATGEGGTGHRAASVGRGVPVAGKTATVMRTEGYRILDGLYNATFAGFAAVHRVNYVIIVKYETLAGRDETDPGSYRGSGRAAMAFAEIVRHMARERDDANDPNGRRN